MNLLDPGAEVAGAIALGRPVANCEVHVLDALGHPVPRGMPGEVYLGGEGVARGYTGRPGITAERFVPDPFSGRPGARIYRTGDRARWREDGGLVYLGRADRQAKIRGFRVEAEEVELALLEHPDVAHAAVIVEEGAADARRLVAYFVGGARAPDPAELREHLRARLPPHAVPAAVLPVAELPLTPNGKLDRAALPVPALAPRAAPAPPRDELERGLERLFGEALGLHCVDIHDDFFALGGHSLLAMRVVARAREELGLELRLRDFIERPTVAALASMGSGRPPEREGPPPITAVQRDRYRVRRSRLHEENET
jgi:hypothetical protein